MPPLPAPGRARRAALQATLVVAVVAGMTTSSPAPAVATAAVPAGACGRAAARGHAVGVPAYVWDTPAWARQLSAPAPAFSIFNPDSGPGPRPDPHFAEQARLATRAGTCLLGYVRTGYGRRDAAAVRREVERYRSWYGVTSIFFDEASWQRASIGYYAALATSVRDRPGSLVALNPGCVPDSAYARLADLLVVFEGTRADYATWQPPSWQHARALPWHLVYGVRPDQLDATLRTARQRGARVVDVTDDSLPNPWDTLPGYLRREVAAFQGGR